MTARARSDRPFRQVRFLLALLLLLPPLLSGYALPLHGPAAIDVILPFIAAVLVYPAASRRRAAALAFGVVSLSAFNLIRHCFAFHRSMAFEQASADMFRVFMVTLAIVGFLAWARWASDEIR